MHHPTAMPIKSQHVGVRGRLEPSSGRIAIRPVASLVADECQRGHHWEREMRLAMSSRHLHQEFVGLEYNLHESLKSMDLILDMQAGSASGQYLAVLCP